MMKKRVFCLALALMLLFAVSVQADGAKSYYRRVQYGTLMPYDNLVYGYSLGVYSRFIMLNDEQMESDWADIDANHEEGDEELYDLRIWVAPDLRYEFEIQVKEPTYASFDIEIAKAPEYADLVRDSYPEDSNLRMLHEGILRSTPAGDMLETAVAYDSADDDGHIYTTVFVYYDIYANGVEYCFSLYAYDGDYKAAQAMLDDICQTVELTPMAVPA